MVIYDVPVWIEEDDLQEAFRTKDKPLSGLFRLSWTPGDITLPAPKLLGKTIQELHRAIINDPKWRHLMYMISMDHQMKERATQMQKSQAGIKLKLGLKGNTHPNRWNVSHVQTSEQAGYGFVLYKHNMQAIGRVRQFKWPLLSTHTFNKQFHGIKARC